MPDVFRVVEQDEVEFGNRFRRFVLAIEAGGEICTRGTEIWRKFERATQQVFGILVATDAPGEFGHHADSGHVERVSLEVRAQQWLGVGQAIIVQRQCSFHQLRIADPALD